jgi:ubiquinone/menaquinone biosynthesis C-methylase UbiE
VTDIRIPSQITIADLNKRGFVFQFANVEDLPFESEFFDRVVSTCLLHHLENPEKGINEMLRVAKKGGTIDILVPNDPSFIYSLSWLATTGVKAIRKKKFMESYTNRKKEHVQELKVIEKLLESQKNIKFIKKKNFPKVFNTNALAVLFRFTIFKS